MATMPSGSRSPEASGWTWTDTALVFGLSLSALFFLGISWRRWPDPLVDFGRQLYGAWRLSRGALLYRDVGCEFGPFSQYFDSIVFRMAGPGLTTLVAAKDEHTDEDPELMRLIEAGYEPMLQLNGQSSTFHRRSLTLWSRAAAPTRGAARAGDRRPGTSTNQSRKVRRAERRARA